MINIAPPVEIHETVKERINEPFKPVKGEFIDPVHFKTRTQAVAYQKSHGGFLVKDVILDDGKGYDVIYIPKKG